MRRTILPDYVAGAANDGFHVGMREKIDLDFDAVADVIAAAGFEQDARDAQIERSARMPPVAAKAPHPNWPVDGVALRPLTTDTHEGRYSKMYAQTPNGILREFPRRNWQSIQVAVLETE